MLMLEIQFLKQLLKHKCFTNILSVMKHYNNWKKTQQKDFSAVTNRIPWMTFSSISYLEQKLRSNCYIFEYGSGGSTLYFLDRGAKVVTVEHDQEWHALLSRIIQENGLARNWTGLFIPPTLSTASKVQPPADPEAYKSNSKKYDKYDFQNYASAIDSYIDYAFDIVSVDGRSRPSCIKHAAQKVKIGGLLLLDNTERAYYLTESTLTYLEDFNIILDEFGPTPGLPWFTKTTVWRRSK